MLRLLPRKHRAKMNQFSIDLDKYNEWLTQQPCCVCRDPGPNVRHHMTGGGMGIKSPDQLQFTLCPSCHGDFHNLSGPFKGWEKNRRREWQAAMVSAYIGSFIIEESTGQRFSPSSDIYDYDVNWDPRG